jgi:hypothetical protein
MPAKPMKPGEIKSFASSIIGNDAKPMPSAPPMPSDPEESADASGKISEQQAGYLELDGAQKDGDCSKVDVQGGVSKDKGCCNVVDPQDGATAFACGQCEYLSGAADDDTEAPEMQ